MPLLNVKLGGLVLLLALPLAVATRAFTDLSRDRVLAGIAAAAAIALAAAAAEWFRILRGIRMVARAAEALGAGRLETRISARGTLRELATSFNEMARRLERRLRELESQRRRHRELIASFGEALAATHDGSQLRRAIVETAVEAVGAVGGVLIDGDDLVVVGDPHAAEHRIELPLTSGQVSFGVLKLFAQRFEADAVMVTTSLAAQAVVALDNARLHGIVERQALVDPLTGLSNRRHGQDALALEISRTARFGDPLALVIVDVDSFKSINDSHGHLFGDRVLRDVADVLRATLRRIDLPTRWGGDEFVLLLPGTDVTGALALAERLRAALADRVLFAPNGSTVTITASFGVAVCPDVGSDAELLAAADEALYAAKRAGKNRVHPAGAAA
jgi:diguanylate cyclase (GGDEF)-like protein